MIGDRVNVYYPTRYDRIILHGDPPERTHHAIIFSPVVPGNRVFTPKSRIWRLFTLTPTGHWWVSKWSVIGSDKSDALRENESALLVPRSWWIWYVPERLMSLGKKWRLFYLEATLVGEGV